MTNCKEKKVTSINSVVKPPCGSYRVSTAEWAIGHRKQLNFYSQFQTPDLWTGRGSHGKNLFSFIELVNRGALRTGFGFTICTLTVKCRRIFHTGSSDVTLMGKSIGDTLGARKCDKLADSRLYNLTSKCLTVPFFFYNDSYNIKHVFNAHSDNTTTSLWPLKFIVLSPAHNTHEQELHLIS